MKSCHGQGCCFWEHRARPHSRQGPVAPCRCSRTQPGLQRGRGRGRGPEHTAPGWPGGATCGQHPGVGVCRGQADVLLPSAPTPPP